ncbi:MAG: chorismate-binding protein, partial [bacterium]
GAPKLRSLQVLQALEPVPRGVYTGAIGWMGDNGDLFFNVSIRTIILADGRAQFGVGGGIVADSKLVDERDESLAKGERLAQALMQNF